ncbi:MAG: D-2-hydroxyacid dehydrogenase, partial [Limisphaerales bacterium]
MKIVVLDGYTMNPGDLSWEEIQSCGTCEFYDRTTPAEVIPRLQDAQAALTNKVQIDRKTLEALPKLKYIGVTATGY